MPRPKPLVVVPEDPAEGLDPIELNQLQQLALGDVNHPMHGYFHAEVVSGTGMELLKALDPESGADLQDIKNICARIAGHAQKIMFWCDRMNWYITHPKDNPYAIEPD